MQVNLLLGIKKAMGHMDSSLIFLIQLSIEQPYSEVQICGKTHPEEIRNLQPWSSANNSLISGSASAPDKSLIEISYSSFIFLMSYRYFLSKITDRGIKLLVKWPLRNSYGVTNSHDFEAPFFYENICGGPSNAQDLSNIVHRICSAFRFFFLFAVPCLRHESPLSIWKEQHKWV